MTVAYDASTSSSTYTTTNPFTFDHTAAAPPQGIVVLISGPASTLWTTSTVTYGGISLALIGQASDLSGELGRVQLWTRNSTLGGAAFPDGMKTVEINHNASAGVKHAVCVSLTGNSSIIHQSTLAAIQADQANPQAAIASSTPAIRVGVCFSGHDDPSSLTAVTGVTTRQSIDFGTSCAVYGVENAPTASFTFGWTASSEDVAFLGAALEETGVNFGLPSKNSFRKRRLYA